MTQYVRHKERKGPIYRLEAGISNHPLAFEIGCWRLPREEYQLCTEQGEWLPEWKNVTLECQLSMNENGTCSIWHRNTRARSSRDVLHPCHASRYKVTIDPIRGSIYVEECV